LAALVTFGIALGFVSLDFYAGVLLLPNSPETGTLVVKAVTGTAAQGTPIVGATVLIDAGSTGKTSEVLTNSSGEAQLQLPVGTHTLMVYNSQFSIPGSVSVQNKATTTADVYVRRYLVRPVFTELTDPDQTGYVSSWQPITVAVNSSSANLLLTSNIVFFNAVYAPGTKTAGSTSTSATSSQGGASSSPSNEIPAIPFSEPVNGSATGLWWFTWLPTVPLPISGLSGLTLSTYSARIQVQTVGT
jgi:hypothetical protein